MSSPIVSDALLDLLGAELFRDRDELRRRLAVLSALVLRRETEAIDRLTEARVEQSFNERVFAEFFDYKTLLSDGRGVFHLLPKQRNASSGRTDDFSLGYFGSGADVVVATMELKSPGTDLDAPQGSGYGSLSPVDQAFRAADGGPALWVLVSNFDEIRLYAANDRTRVNVLRLSEITTLETARRALALLDRSSLLGRDVGSSPPGDSSPLTRLRTGGSPSMLSALKPSIRLVQEAYSTPADVDIPFHRLDDGLREALAFMERYRGHPAWPQCSLPPHAFQIDLDRLVLSTPEPSPNESSERSRFEFSKSGVLRSWEAVYYIDGTGDRLPNCDAVELARRIALFILLARKAFASAMGTLGISFRWRFYDLTADVECVAPAEWLETTGEPRTLRLPRDQPVIMATADRELRLDRFGEPLNLVRLVTPVVRELLYPFEYRHAAGAKRVAPNDGDIRNALEPVVQMLLPPP